MKIIAGGGSRGVESPLRLAAIGIILDGLGKLSKALEYIRKLKGNRNASSDPTAERIDLHYPSGLAAKILLQNQKVPRQANEAVLPP